MITRRQVLLTARTYLGTPFHHAGRLKDVGVDCVGLIIAVARDLGLSSFDFTVYGRKPAAGLLEKLLGENLTQIPVRDARAGDILLMRFAREPQHVAFKTSRGLLHSHMGVGRVVEHRMDAAWRNRVVGAFRFPGVL